MKKIYKYLGIIILMFVILLTTIYFLSNKKEEPKNEYNGWRSNIERINYMNVTDFAKNKCNKKYYSPTFSIDENNILHDYNNNIIDEGIFSIYLITYGKCDVQLIFITTLNGQLYYVNNLVDSSYKKYQFVEIEDVLNVSNISVDEEDNIVVTDNLGTEEIITDKVDLYIKNDIK